MEIRHGGNLQEISEKYQLTEPLIDFSANINPLGMPKEVQHALSQAVTELGNYPDLRYAKLREAIAKFHEVDKNWVYPTNGAAEAIFNLASVLQTKKLLLLAPTFMEYEGAFRNYQTTFCYFELEEQDFQVNIEKLIAFAQKENCDAICLCNPNNPTGKVLSKEVLQSLVTFCQAKQIRLIIDEAFIDFTDEKKNSLVSELENYRELYILRSLTKMYGIPGIRLGYLLTANQRVLNALAERTIPWHINTFADVAGQAALKDRNFIYETKKVIERERHYLLQGLQKFSTTIKTFESDVNYLFFEYLGSDNLQEKLIKKGFLIRSCDSFRGLSKKYYRVAVKDHQKNQLLLAALGEIL